MLDWAKFEQVAGLHPSAHAFSFESLCRGIVIRQFRNHGPIKELKNQPGVEFHLELESNDPRLGEKGEKVGWQCKWFQYNSNGQLNSSAKQQIEHSLKTTKKHLPELNVWILWTHKTLTKADQDWFYNLQTVYGFTLQLWTDDDIKSYLSGPATELRATYFGELALTPDMLSEQHTTSVAPIRSRWIHEVHQSTNVERDIRRVLGEPSAWSDIYAARVKLDSCLQTISEYAKQEDYKSLTSNIEEFISFCEQVTSSCKVFESTVSGREIGKIANIAQSPGHTKNISQLLRLTRRQNQPLSLYLTNANALIKDIKKLLSEAIELFAHQLIAVIGKAGRGKTQLAAEVTSYNADRLAGILLHGKRLRKGGTLDSLVQDMTFASSEVRSFEKLLSALDSAGERNRCRVPVVIDGLNEAEDPRDWKSLLASIRTVLSRYPNVVLICTLRDGYQSQQHLGAVRFNSSTREGFAQQALPNDCFELQLKAFSDEVTIKAIKSYFRHYKISANPLAAPQSFFSHPLNLKIFCEVTNRSRKNGVVIQSFPSSIYSLFKEQVTHIGNTISEMTNLSIRYTINDVENAVYYLGEALWEANGRSILESDFLQKYNPHSTDWDSNIVNLLSQEGLIFRDVVRRGEYRLSPAYDRLGGYIIAFYLMEHYCLNRDVSLFESKEFLEKTFNDVPVQHELSEDILYALVAIASQYNLPHIWKVIPSDYTNEVLSLSHLIEPNFICDETVEELKNLILNEGLKRKHIESLVDVRLATSHPLNAEFLSDVLLNMSMVDRDLSWGEYVRRNHDELIKGIRYKSECWKSQKFSEPDTEELRLITLIWFLNSVVTELRDISTQALVFYGVHNTKSFLEIVKPILAVDDEYILERIIAACYSVISISLDKSENLVEIEAFSKHIVDVFFSHDSKYATTNILVREYASCLVKRASLESKINIDKCELEAASHPFKQMPRNQWDEVTIDGVSGILSPLKMDFENYTIGRLVKNRSNYDYEHEDYAKTRNQILWKVYDLGWSEDKFGELDKQISSSGYHNRNENKKIERYGKKYAWIAYYQMAGQRLDSQQLEFWGERFIEGIDPFFPSKSLTIYPLSDKIFLGDRGITTEEWINHSEDPTLGDLSHCAHLENDNWILVDASIVEESKRSNRHFYASVNSFLVFEASLKDLDIEESSKLEFPEVRSLSDVYLGELYSYFSHNFEPQVIKEEDGEEEIEVEPNVFFGGEANVTSSGTQIITVPKYKEHSLKEFIFEYSSEHRNSSFSMPVLAPSFVKEHNLKFDCELLCYFKDGQQISKYVVEDVDGYSNTRKRLYLEEEFLTNALKSSGYRIISLVKGERRVSDVGYNGTFQYKSFENIDFLNAR
ncbi:hypothetical protein L1D28_05635 [Vibrio chagasii]|uniref:NACHT domain-containing protein n=1 Tax=Vibrio chagasii TaxID=170679 RepID=UPI001EFCDF9C|nr:hypothetical protein [Vibrio chagasii]MCG9561124.1 hypothetical protein [Vibrio chagasii]